MPSNEPTVRLDERTTSMNVRAKPTRRVHETRSEATLPSKFPFAKKNWRIIVLGSAHVGKTSLLSRFIHSRLPDRPTRHLDEMHRMEIDVGGHVITVEILDTTGYNNFPIMQEVAIRQADCFMLVFSVDSEESLETLKELRQQILRIKNTQEIVPIVVVANKMDLEPCERTVDLNYVDFLIKCDWENCGLAKTSAKCDTGVQDCFKELLLCMKSRLPSNTPVRRIGGNLSRMNSAPAGLREDTTKFISPKLLRKLKDRDRQRSNSPTSANDLDCLIT